MTALDNTMSAVTRTIRTDSPHLEGSLIEVWDTGGDIRFWFIVYCEPDREGLYTVNTWDEVPEASPKEWKLLIRPATPAEISKDEAERAEFREQMEANEAHRRPCWRRLFS